MHCQLDRWCVPGPCLGSATRRWRLAHLPFGSCSFGARHEVSHPGNQDSRLGAGCQRRQEVEPRDAGSGPLSIDDDGAECGGLG